MACGNPLVHGICPGIHNMTLPALCATFVYLGWTDDMYGVPRKTDVRPSMARRVAKYPKVQTWAGSETYLVAPAKWPTSIAWDVTPFEFANGPAAFAPLAHTAQVSCLGLRALTGYAMGVPEAALADWHDTAVAKLLAEMRTAISQLNETPILCGLEEQHGLAPSPAPHGSVAAP